MGGSPCWTSAWCSLRYLARVLRQPPLQAPGQRSILPRCSHPISLPCLGYAAGGDRVPRDSRAGHADSGSSDACAGVYLLLVVHPLFGLSASNQVTRIMVMVFLPIFCVESELGSNWRACRGHREERIDGSAPSSAGGLPVKAFREAGFWHRNQMTEANTARFSGQQGAWQSLGLRYADDLPLPTLALLIRPPRVGAAALSED